MHGEPPDLCDAVPFCPICGGKMELVYNRPNTKVCVCIDCHTGITVPASAWTVAMRKRPAAAR